MRIKVYKYANITQKFMHPEQGRLHCLITICKGEGRFEFFDTEYEDEIRKLFSNPVTELGSGGSTSEGARWDAAVTYPPWSKEAVESVANDLFYRGLDTVIEFDEAD